MYHTCLPHRTEKMIQQYILFIIIIWAMLHLFYTSGMKICQNAGGTIGNTFRLMKILSSSSEMEFTSDTSLEYLLVSFDKHQADWNSSVMKQTKRL